MSDEIQIAGEGYISSKRASEVTGYAQDYIGQLARKGLVEGKRISGLWYVSLKSLEQYKRDAGAYKPTPPEQRKLPPEVDALIAFDGKDFVSAGRAAGITGYHADYVGQLAREGKVLSRQVGSRWYVDREGILSHKKTKDALLAVVQREAVGIPKKEGSAAAQTLDYRGAGPYLTYTQDNGDLFPVLSTAERRERESISASRDVSTLESRDRAHTIPIRKMSSNGEITQAPMTQGGKIGLATASTGKRSRLLIQALPVVAATVVITLTLGYVWTQRKPVYAQNQPENQAMFALAGQLQSVLARLGDKVEAILSPEILYRRGF